MHYLPFFVLILIANSFNIKHQNIQIVMKDSTCNHPIFCNPEILQAAADSGLFEDSKTFVDLILKAPVKEVLQNFKKQSTTDFIKNNFHLDPNLLLATAKFSDFKETPELINRIQDPQMKKFAKQLNNRWNQLGKKVDFSKAQTVGTCKEQCSSYLEEVNQMTMLVPGGRFRQSYYWDTYWIILGLISCDMLDTAQLLLSNFGKIIEKYGYIPNGFRSYFLNRSQPPYYFLMVQAVVKALEKKGQLTQANQLAISTYQILVKQHTIIDQNHLLITYIKGELYSVNQYRANTESPRPESYKEDIETVSIIKDPTQKKRVLKCLSSMAESGWDFSSRWLKGTHLTTSIIDKIVPTDFNALMGMMEQYLAEMSQKYGTKDDIEYYTSRYGQRMSYFNKIKTDERYPDYDLTQSKKQGAVYPTDFFPYIFLKEKHSVSSIYKDKVNPVSSFNNTGQQWDSPNVWAPNNWILHEISPQKQARDYAQQWVHTTYCSFVKHGFLYEKYLNSKLGERGEGGEYAPQIGFGWTNGLALHYLNLYPDIKKPECQ